MHYTDFNSCSCDIMNFKVRKRAYVDQISIQSSSTPDPGYKWEGSSLKADVCKIWFIYTCACLIIELSSNLA